MQVKQVVDDFTTTYLTHYILLCILNVVGFGHLYPSKITLKS